MRNKALIIALLLIAAGLLTGCKVWEGAGKFFKAVAEAAEPEYYWTRQKITEDATWSADIGDTKTWLEENRAKPMETLLPSDVARAIPKDYTRGLDSLKEIHPSAFVRYTVMKSENGEWNREVFYALNEGEEVALEVQGPGIIMVISMCSLSRDEPLDNVRKYIYARGDKTGTDHAEPAYCYRRNDILFEHTESESASVPHVSVIRAPEGKHTYTFRYRYSDGGDILLKFFETVYP